MISQTLMYVAYKNDLGRTELNWCYGSVNRFIGFKPKQTETIF